MPCGQCKSCRINRRGEKLHRLKMEKQLHVNACFTTLTYDDDHLPKTENGLATLNPRDLNLFLKRLRKRAGSFRFFAVGEYGDETERPHYHVIFYGFKGCDFGVCRRNREKQVKQCCSWGRLIEEVWRGGRQDSGELTDESMQYVAGYTIKKLTGELGAEWLKGRHDIFTRSSTRPGLGRDFIKRVAETISRDPRDLPDVPAGLLYSEDGKIRLRPFDDYSKRKLREDLGREPTVPKEVALTRSAALRLVFEDGKAVQAHLEEVDRQGEVQLSKFERFERKGLL